MRMSTPSPFRSRVMSGQARATGLDFRPGTLKSPGEAVGRLPASNSHPTPRRHLAAGDHGFSSTFHVRARRFIAVPQRRVRDILIIRVMACLLLLLQHAPRIHPARPRRSGNTGGVIPGYRRDVFEPRTKPDTRFSVRSPIKNLAPRDGDEGLASFVWYHPDSVPDETAFTGHPH